MSGAEGGAILSSSGAVVFQPTGTAVETGRPVGIPVVVVAAADAVGCSQVDDAIAAEGSGQEDPICGRAKPIAIVRTELCGHTAEHRERGRRRGGRDHLFGTTLGPCRVHLDVVARTGW